MNSPKPVSPALVVIAYALVYVVWGSTYFFIQMAIHGFPPMLMGATRFLIAGVLMLSWCKIKGDNIWQKKDIVPAGISGLLMLFGSIGIVIWAEQTVPSAMVAIIAATGPIWIVIIDKAHWHINLKSKTTIAGLILGFGGVFLLFGEAVNRSINGLLDKGQITGLILVLFAPIVWSAGGLYSKYKGSNIPARLNTGWQMLIGGIFYIPLAVMHGELNAFHISSIPLKAWLAVAYLVIFGSIVAFSAYVWLLSVKPAAQVSTHAYVNPVIAVILGVLFAHESISLLQLGGLLVILFSVLLVNFSKYSFRKKTAEQFHPDAA
ncbi:EamA family transporter [Mucilaginibacter mali]|uniref:EamA family transporter n=1 Tax=Mucilaginibacter mali TaxID=2740462 RepID=A0A7D4Q776_9SPHI|nr:EamA family transporter [Mucilaginibacter mali]QKJ32747.1 EamA family transporter [Mucilaginibacter mali]